jgi:voltage-gated potassium channel Kch
MNFFSNVSKRFLTTSNSILLFIVIFTIFFVPFFPIEWHRILYSICYTLIFLLSALALSKNRSRIFIIAVLVILIEWFSELFNFPILSKISLVVNIFFFGLIVVLFIMQIARAKTVTPLVIMESINGYLMLGMSFSILIALISIVNPNSFSFPHLTTGTDLTVSYFSNYTYYGFVTLTTLGYGDVVPLTSAAKSFSIFTAITGQMYVAIIIAALVAKYLNQSKLK